LVRRLKAAGGEAPHDRVAPELIEACKQGDERAWSELVEATHRDVYALCYRILGNPDDAAEATQETFLKVWRNLKGFRGEAMFTTWLYRVATNTAITRQRSRSRKLRHETGGDDEALSSIPGPGSVEDAAGARVEVRELERALQDLPEVYRGAVVLRDVYEMSIEEIAATLKISETAAKVRVHRGRKKLKEMLYPEESS
jgi:RNA polymerase sigma-70 factor (ECF subfamily)